jgi:hypothetical protein
MEHFVLCNPLSMNARPLLTDRLEFFAADKAVGFFLSRHYPSHPGRYLYDPYRGEGHALLVSQLEKGDTVECRYFCGDIEFSIIVAQEVFVPATPESYWFIDIIKIEPLVGKTENALPTTKPDVSALFPVRMLKANLQSTQ